MPPQDDAELVRRANRGDTTAFEALLDRHSSWVLGLAHRLVSDPELALDLRQEAFRTLWSRFPGFRLRAPSLRAFLYPVVVRLAGRAATRERERRVAPLPENEAGAAPKPSLERADTLRALLDRLPPPQREVVFLRFLHDLTGPEIAAALEIPEGTVRSRLHEALAALRRDPRSHHLRG